MNKRLLLIIFSIIIILAIILLVSFTQKDFNPYDIESDNYLKNTESVLNQGSEFLKYDNNLYFINDRTKAIIKYNSKENIVTPIISLKGYDLGDKLHLISNKLIYTVGQNTYYSNLDGTDTYKFASGRVVYINDDVYVYIVEKDSYQSLYVASYDSKTFMRTNDIFFNLANGYKIRYIKVIEDILFFESENTDRSLTLFSIDLKEYKSKVIARREMNTGDDYSQSKFSDVIQNDKSLYFIFSDISTTTYGESDTVDNSIYGQEVEFSISEFVANEVENRLYFAPTEEKELIYEKYNDETQKYDWYNESHTLLSYEWEDIVEGDVKKYFEYKDSAITKDNEAFLSLDSAYAPYSLEIARYYYGEFYFMLSHESGSHIWFTCKRDGSELKKIYEWRQ